MKTICTLDGRIIMSQDGDALATMERNAAQYPGAVASVVTDEAFAALVAAQADSADHIPGLLAEFRLLREQVLNRLTGVHIDMQAIGDTAGMAAVVAARVALRSIPQHPTVTGATSVTEFKDAVRALYWQTSADLYAASPTAFAAFRGLDV